MTNQLRSRSQVSDEAETTRQRRDDQRTRTGAFGTISQKGTSLLSILLPIHTTLIPLILKTKQGPLHSPRFCPHASRAPRPPSSREASVEAQAPRAAAVSPPTPFLRVVLLLSPGPKPVPYIVPIVRVRKGEHDNAGRYRCRNSPEEPLVVFSVPDIRRVHAHEAGNK